MADTIEYGPSGQVIASNVTTGNPYKFNTKYTDSETDLVYYGFRYYNPEDGRWLNRDPIGYAGGINIYNAVSNNMVNGYSANRPNGYRSGMSFMVGGFDGGINLDATGHGLLSWLGGAGWSGPEADAFDISIGESLISQGTEMRRGVDVIRNREFGLAREQIIEDSSDRYARIILNNDSVTTMYLVAANDITGGTQIGEAIYGVDIAEQRLLTPMERTQRGLMGGGQVLLTASAVGSARNSMTGVTRFNASQGLIEEAKTFARSFGGKRTTGIQSITIVKNIKTGSIHFATNVGKVGMKVSKVHWKLYGQFVSASARNSMLKFLNKFGGKFAADKVAFAWRSATNCSEFRAVNMVLLQGSKLKHLRIHTLRYNGNPMAPCPNCTVTVVPPSGWISPTLINTVESSTNE